MRRDESGITRRILNMRVDGCRSKEDQRSYGCNKRGRYLRCMNIKMTSYKGEWKRKTIYTETTYVE